MSLFKSQAEKDLDAVIQRMEMNLSNNYKDNAQENLAEFQRKFDEYVASSKIRGKTRAKYQAILDSYREKLKGYSHKDQKPYWH